MNSRLINKVNELMKKLTHYFLAFSILFTSTASLARDPIYTIINDNSAPCFKYCPMLGLYVDMNIGYTIASLDPHRPDLFGLPPLRSDTIKNKSVSFIPALGFDLYPCSRVPVRAEINYLYTDQSFDTFFITNEGLGITAKDRFLIRDIAGTLYFDWHTCTRFVPYVGLTAGLMNFKTYHRPIDPTLIATPSYSDTQQNFSWGATIGTRYFFNNYIFGNLQLRFDNLGPIGFKNFSDESVALSQQLEYESDYVHETTIMIGLGYVF